MLIGKQFLVPIATLLSANTSKVTRRVNSSRAGVKRGECPLVNKSEIRVIGSLNGNKKLLTHREHDEEARSGLWKGAMQSSSRSRRRVPRVEEEGRRAALARRSRDQPSSTEGELIESNSTQPPAGRPVKHVLCLWLRKQRTVFYFHYQPLRFANFRTRVSG